MHCGTRRCDIVLSELNTYSKRQNGFLALFYIHSTMKYEFQLQNFSELTKVKNATEIPALLYSIKYEFSFSVSCISENAFHCHNFAAYTHIVIEFVNIKWT